MGCFYLIFRSFTGSFLSGLDKKRDNMMVETLNGAKINRIMCQNWMVKTLAMKKNSLARIQLIKAGMKKTTRRQITLENNVRISVSLKNKEKMLLFVAP